MVDSKVHAYPGPPRNLKSLNSARGGQKIRFRIFSINPANQGSPDGLNIPLSQGKLLPLGNADLCLHDIHPSHHFCDRVFYLETGIEFEVIEVSLRGHKKFHSPRPGIFDGDGSGEGYPGHSETGGVI